MSLFSYPYAIVVPEKLTDGTISNMAAEFTGNRFPAAVWRNKSTGATLLRSSAILSLSVKSSKMAFSHPNFLSEGDKADAKPKEQDRKGLTKISEIESLIRGILESVWRIRCRGDTFNSLSTGFESAVQESRMSDTEDGGLLDETAGGTGTRFFIFRALYYENEVSFRKHHKEGKVQYMYKVKALRDNLYTVVVV